MGGGDFDPWITPPKSGLPTIQVTRPRVSCEHPRPETRLPSCGTPPTRIEARLTSLHSPDYTVPLVKRSHITRPNLVVDFDTWPTPPKSSQSTIQVTRPHVSCERPHADAHLANFTTPPTHINPRLTSLNRPDRTVPPLARSRITDQIGRAILTPGSPPPKIRPADHPSDTTPRLV